MARKLIFDTDTHVAEAPDLWSSRMSSKWGDLIPQVRWDERKKRESWFVGDNNMGWVGACSAILVDPETGERYRAKENGEVASLFVEMHPSAYDAKARLERMDELGVQAATLYPNFNLVVSDMHSVVEDPEFKMETIRAYNDWLVEWASAAPDRLIPLAVVAHFDVKRAAEEAYRCAELGHRGLVMTGMPHRHKQPYLADRYWDPLWKAAEESGLSISFHIGTNPESMSAANRARLPLEGFAGLQARSITAMCLDNANSLNDLLWSGILPRFPNLKFVCVETGMGWVNFCLESADYHFEHFNVGEHRAEFEELPSFYFKRQVYTTFWFEKLYPFHVERLGATNILFETDYPHHGSLDEAEIKWIIEDGLSLVPEDVAHRVLWQNAADLYRVPAPAAVAS